MRIPSAWLGAGLGLVSCTDPGPRMTHAPDDFLPGYTGQTTEELIALAEDFQTASVVLAFEQALQERAKERALTEEESWVLAVEALEREVNNGGFLQFFGSMSSGHVPVVVRALEAISCPRTADLTARGIATLGIRGGVTEEAIAEAIDAREEEISESLEALDSEYYRLGEDIAGRLLEFIRANRQRIRAES